MNAATREASVPINLLNMSGWQELIGPVTFEFIKGQYPSGNLSLQAEVVQVNGVSDGRVLLFLEPGTIFDVVSTDFYEQRWVQPGEFIMVPSKSAFSPALLAQLRIAEDTGRQASAGYHVDCPILPVLF